MDSSRHFAGADFIEAPELQDTSDTRSGRAAWDERGNSVWEWQTQPGVYTRNVSREQFEGLQARQLRLVDSAARGAGSRGGGSRGVEMSIPRHFRTA